MLFIKRCLILVGVSLQSTWIFAVGYDAEKSTPTGNSLIQIAVEVVELNQQKSQQLGIDWMEKLHLSEVSVPAIFTAGTFTRDALAIDIDAMIKEGAADLLANPKLVTREGTTATFDAGGEIPYIVAGSQGTASTEFKPYGVRLTVRPKITSLDQISLNLEAEVSALDDQRSVTLSGNTVPGIQSRQVTSELLLAPGTTLTLAGMLQTKQTWDRKGIPFLAKIPLLGYLFSRKVEVHEKTNIVVFVTPTILPAVIPPILTNPQNTAEDDSLLEDDHG